MSVNRVQILPHVPRLLRPEMGVFLLCYLLPDLLDKPIFWLWGIGSGRYLGHTILFLFVTGGVFSLWRRAYGLLALCGVALHFILDSGWFMPWFYPLVKYDFPDIERNESFNLHEIGSGFLELACVAIGAFVILCLLSWLRKRIHGRSEGKRHASE